MMNQPYAATFAQAEPMPDDVVERMRRADSAVRPWVDAAFRARIDPDVPEVVGPPFPVQTPRFHR